MALTGAGGRTISKSVANPGQTSIFKKSPAVAVTTAPRPGGSVASAPAPTPSPFTSSGGGGYTGGGAPAAAPAAPPAAPPPMTDIDWFNKDTTFRNQATVASNDLVDQLAQLLFQRNQGFQAVDNQRRDWGESRDQDQEDLGESFAARGLGSSGLYRSSQDDLLGQYEKRRGDIDQGESQLTQQLGARGSLANGIDRSGLVDQNYGALAAIYGLLGQQGVQAGNAYNSKLQGLRGESVGRANQDIVKTLGW